MTGEFVGDGFQPSKVKMQLENMGVYYDPEWFFDRFRA